MPHQLADGESDSHQDRAIERFGAARFEAGVSTYPRVWTLRNSRRSRSDLSRLTAAVVQASPPDSTFAFAAGVHRGVTVWARTGDRYLGEPGAVLDGAVVLAMRQQGDRWVADAPPQWRGAGEGQCRTDRPNCATMSELFIGDRRLEPAGTAAGVDADHWYLDASSELVVLGVDPGAEQVQLSVVGAAFIAPEPAGATDGVTDVAIEGLTIEHYATDAHAGAIDARGVADWTISGNTIRANHGTAVFLLGDRAVIRGNALLANGRSAVGLEGVGHLVEGNEIAFNNTAGFDQYWDAGGAKFALTDHLVVRANDVHDNDGPGLWTDVANDHTLYEDNIVVANEEGIYHEISYSATIRHNTLRDNGTRGNRGWVFGSGSWWPTPSTWRSVTISWTATPTASTSSTRTANSAPVGRTWPATLTPTTTWCAPRV